MSKIGIKLALYMIILYDRSYVDSIDKPGKNETQEKVSMCNNDETPGLTDVDIKNKAPNENYTFYREGNVAIYYVRMGLSFRSVNQSDTEIWRGTSVSGNAKKVVVEGMGKPKKTVTIYLWTNQTIKFHKSGKNKPWSEIKFYEEQLLNDKLNQYKCEKADTPVPEQRPLIGYIPRYKKKDEQDVIPKIKHPQEIVIVTEGSEYENDTDKYIVKHKIGSEVYDYDFANESRCVKVKCEGEELWKLEEDNNYPVTMSFRRSENIVVIRFTYGFNLYVKRLDKWMLHPYLSRLKREYNPYMKKRDIKTYELKLKM